MNSTPVLAPPAPTPIDSHGADAVAPSLGALFGTTQPGSGPNLNKNSWRADAAKFNAGLANLLDGKADVNEVNEISNTLSQPIDRGPADAAKYLRTWQYQVTGKVAAAAVLTELGCKPIKCGGPLGMSKEATGYIQQYKLDDTFYIVDLGNVLRMLKAR